MPTKGGYKGTKKSIDMSNTTKNIVVHIRVRQDPFDMGKTWVDLEHICNGLPSVSCVSQALKIMKFIRGRDNTGGERTLFLTPISQSTKHTYMDEEDGRGMSCCSGDGDVFESGCNGHDGWRRRK